MFHILSTNAAGRAAATVARLRDIAPWIAGFEKPLRDAIAATAALTDAAQPEALCAEIVEGLGEARRLASLQRWREGPAEWRRWAESVHRLQSQLAIDTRAERLLAWLAFADFSHQAFPQMVDFCALEFPAGASFAGAQFLADVWFSRARFGGPADFRGVRFCRDAFFEQAWFKAQADFCNAIFFGSARLSACIALSGISAERSEFGGDLWIRASQFFGPVNFVQSRISGEAGFGACSFHDVDFSRAEFLDNAGFEELHFSGAANFEHTVFGRNARFERSHFAMRPRFKAARFFRAGHFDDAMIPVMDLPVANSHEEIERRLRLSMCD